MVSSSVTPSANAPWDFSAWTKSVRVNIAGASSQDWSYIDTGGPLRPFVLLPGSVGTCEIFYKQIVALSDRWRIIAVTYPPVSAADQLADGLGALFDMLELREPNVLGSSFAAYWLQAFAVRHPQKFRSLVVGNGFAEPSPLFPLPLFDPDIIRSSSPAHLQHLWRERVVGSPDSDLRPILLDMLSGRQSAEVLKSRFIGVIEGRLMARPPLDVERRMIILECGDDPVIPPAAREQLRLHLPEAHAIRLATGGHYPHVLNTQAYHEALKASLPV